MKTKKSFFKNLLPYLKPYWPQTLGLGIVMILVGVIDATFALWTRYAVDTFIVPGTTDGLDIFIYCFLGLVLLQGINVFILIMVAGYLEMALMYDLRNANFAHVQDLELDYFNRTAGGWLLSRITSDIQRIGQTISWGFVDITWGFTTITSISIVMFILNWQLALITLSVVPFLIWVSRYFQNRIFRSQRLVRRTNSRITASYNEALMGAMTTKTLSRENESLKEFKHLSQRMNRMSVISARISALYQPVVMVLGAIGTALALWNGGLRVSLEVLTFGTLAAFLSYTVQLFDPLRELARVFGELQSARAAGERVFTLLDTPVEIIDSPEIIQRYGSVLSPRPEHWPTLRGSIRFENVWFRYNNGEQILENFSLQIPAGQSIALVGATGSGKSTLVNLICRFYEPNEGKIYIDDRDYRDYGLACLHGNLGYVLQSPQLFSGSIEENIRYGKLSATLEEIVQAAKVANAHDFISRLPDGYKTQVGEEGAKLSTGQKQLISFTRAILADPAILILDEATSSIDTESESLIQEAIHKVLLNRTSLIIAHRLSTIKDADRILVIEKGKVIEDGNHQELLSFGGHYYRLYENQYFQEQEEKFIAGAPL
ncbi:MAG: ABC transporter ATP-binding protein [Spirochaetales bacterium]|nr:ABC transporter ATP-binding protein [Spirochaetales bacterium]